MTDAQRFRTTPSQAAAITARLAVDRMKDPSARDRYLAVLRYCARCIDGGFDWPDKDFIAPLYFLDAGGTWLEEIEAGILEAELSPYQRNQWMIAFNGAQALLREIHK